MVDGSDGVVNRWKGGEKRKRRMMKRRSGQKYGRRWKGDVDGGVGVSVGDLEKKEENGDNIFAPVR